MWTMAPSAHLCLLLLAQTVFGLASLASANGELSEAGRLFLSLSGTNKNLSPTEVVGVLEPPPAKPRLLLGVHLGAED